MRFDVCSFPGTSVEPKQFMLDVSEYNWSEYPAEVHIDRTEMIFPGPILTAGTTDGRKSIEP